jgi:hypothetical protein
MKRMFPIIDLSEKNLMKTKNILLALAAGCLVAGCAKTTRSISQSGYGQGGSYPAPYARELDEFDVLGIDRNKPATEEDIQGAVRAAKPVRAVPGTTILLVQSGAVFPDSGMVTELGKSFRVVPFTGLANEPQKPDASVRDNTTRSVAIISDPDKPATVVPLSMVARERYKTPAERIDPGAYSRTLRLAAARAGASVVVCYWGILESGTQEHTTKVISWIPAVNWVVPDETQHMRINVKVAVVDVASGSWSVFSVQPEDTKSLTRHTRREATDQRLVESLKAKAYEMAARDLARL